MLWLVFALLAGCQAAALSREEHLVQLQAAAAAPEKAFSAWLLKHGKAYANDAAETGKRFKIWSENLAFALEYNAAHHSHWLGMNSMADLSQEEYAQRYLGFDNSARKALRAQKLASNKLSSFKYADADEASLPTAVDWRKQGAVSEVKNQQQCGSCWAFSTTGSVEGINAIVTKQLVSLSEQELVDCDTEQDKGCHGGLMDYAYQFIIKNGGLDTEEHYPYTAEEGQCAEKHKKHNTVTIDGYEDVPENDEAALKKAVAHQPVSVAIEADQKAFQLYMGGVFSDDTCGTELDHGVLVVGYGVDPKEGRYWVVKNSWGGEWGEQGYIRLKAGAKDKEGLCGIAMAASYPTKTSPNPPQPGPEPGPDPGPTPGPSPKPPKPQPVQCDDTSECPAGTTCCCVTEFLNMCLQWGCCPMESAVCCADHQHCCPPSLPVCDTQGGRCMPQSGAPAALGQPWMEKQPAKRSWHVLDSLFMRGGVKQAQQEKNKKSSVLVVA